MKQKSANDNLNDAIFLLQEKQTHELLLLKEQFHITIQSLKPINLIKNVFQEVTQSTEIKKEVADNLIGLTTGYITQKVLIGATTNPLKILFGTILQLAVTNIVSKNADGIKAAGENLLNHFLKSKQNLQKCQQQNNNS